MARDVESVLLEADYWKAALEDILVLNDLTARAGSSLPNASMAMLDLMLGAEAETIVERVNNAIRPALNALQDMHEPIMRLVDLAKGREIVMRREVGGEGE